MLPSLAESAGQIIPIVAIVAGCTVGAVSIIAKSMRHSQETRQRETSRREIAAYIAEGSMTPEQGEKLMTAGGSPKPKG